LQALQQQIKTQGESLAHCTIFFHPDYTVGIGVSPIQRTNPRGDCTVADCNRRSGISPCPEDQYLVVFGWKFFVTHAKV